MALLKKERAYDFYYQIMRHARDAWGMTMLFKDDLRDQGARVAAQYVGQFGAKREWLGGMTAALADLGMSMQACMTAPSEIMMSAEGMPALTNARVSGDGGRDVGLAALGSLLTSLVGVGWSKDNVRTADPEQGNVDAMQTIELQMLVAALSLGPVGIADALSALPSDPTARITSNVSLVKGAIALNGTLLQPSFPLTPLASFCAGSSTCSQGAHASSVWATHTAVPCGGRSAGARSSTAAPCFYFTVVGFSLEAPRSAAAPMPSPTAGPINCTFIRNADKMAGHCFKTINNTTRAACCDSCVTFRHSSAGSCEAAVRDPVAGTCYLITGTAGNHQTRKSNDREVFFMPPTPPTPPIPPPPPFAVSLADELFPLVDAGPSEVRGFAEPPAGFFLGAGDTAPASAYVMTRGRHAAADGGQCATWVDVAGSVGVGV